MACGAIFRDAVGIEWPPESSRSGNGPLAPIFRHSSIYFTSVAAVGRSAGLYCRQARIIAWMHAGYSGRVGSLYLQARIPSGPAS